MERWFLLMSEPHLKESHSIEVAEYAKILGVDHKPAFNWWVPHLLKKRDHIISLVKKCNPRYLKQTHKIGMEVPKTVNEALALDKKNDNTLWADALLKYWKMFMLLSKFSLMGSLHLLVFRKYPASTWFDVKMEDFCPKARLVSGGHRSCLSWDHSHRLFNGSLEWPWGQSGWCL